jgi:hypothetical protein
MIVLLICIPLALIVGLLWGYAAGLNSRRAPTADDIRHEREAEWARHRMRGDLNTRWLAVLPDDPGVE